METNAQHTTTPPVDAERILKRVGLNVGMNFADFGVGRLAPFAFAAAQVIGSEGRVFVLDVVKGVLGFIMDRAKTAGFKNFVDVWTDLEMYGAAKQVPDGTVDVGVLSDTLFQSKQHEAMMRECSRMVRSNGTLVVVDWKPGNTVLGPPQEHRVSPDSITEIAARIGLRLTEAFEAGEYHWGLVFKKS